MAAKADRTTSVEQISNLRRSGLDPIGAIPWGSHFCQFYQWQHDLVDVVLPYFRAGIEDRELCLWLTSYPLGLGPARSLMKEAFANAESLFDSGQLQIALSEDWYLPDGTFDPQRIIAAWKSKAGEARDRGLTGLRLLADVGWLTPELWDPFRDYEAQVDSVLATEAIVALCAYPLEAAPANHVFDVARTHQFSIARRAGRWEIMEAADHIGALDNVLQQNATLQAEVEQRTAALDSLSARLKQRRDRYRFLAENTSDIIILYDWEGTRVYVSPSVTRVLGALPDKLLGGVHPDDLPSVKRAWEAVHEGTPQTITCRHRHASGSWRWLVGSSRVDLQACKLEYSIVSPK